MGLKSASRSLPLVTFNHSTTTTPLKATGSAGRRTRIRVAKLWAGRRLGLPPPVGAPTGSQRPGVRCCVSPDEVLRLHVADVVQIDRRVGQPVVGVVPRQRRLAGDRILRRPAAIGEEHAARREDHDQATAATFDSRPVRPCRRPRPLPWTRDAGSGSLVVDVGRLLGPIESPPLERPACRACPVLAVDVRSKRALPTSGIPLVCPPGHEGNPSKSQRRTVMVTTRADAGGSACRRFAGAHPMT